VSRALSDVRVVALEQYAAGPYGSLHLAELGADVIKIEQPPGGDVGRGVPPYRAEDDSLFFQALNRSKRSVCLDVSTPAGRRVLEDLVRVSDGVYSNLRGDVPARLGITYDQLAHLNPRIVCCTLTGYGTTGPRAAQPGFDYMVQGLTGWMSITGEPDGPPSKTGLSAVDFATGLVAALSLVSGIHTARRDGVGSDCDVSLLETGLSMLNYLATWSLSRDYEPQRIARSGHPTLVPFGNFPTSDGWIVAGGSKEKFWQRLAVALGRADLLEDPRYVTFETRLAHRGELTSELDAVFRTRDTAAWIGVLEAAGVPCSPINQVGEAFADPQVQARDAVFFLDHPTLGSVGHVASPVRAGAAPHVRQPAPRLGEHTGEVLEGLLGYSPSQVERLARDGVVAGPGLPVPAGLPV
jgi:crotonobetainyl-CoA:carnitine CoA-transferase CaiB-like acyl-CoA transferase